MPLLRARLSQLRRQGPRRLAQTAASIVEDAWFDWRHGTETRAKVAIPDLGPVRGDSAAHGEAYHPTRARHFRKLMAALDLPDGLGFADIGAGKGLVLMLATEQRFARVVGVEYADAMVSAARDNLDRYRRVTGRGGQVALHHDDAARFPIDDDLNVFYLFNPFGEAVWAAVVDNIRASLARSPRPCWIIANKAQPDALAAGGFQVALDMAYGNAEFRVYAR